MITVRTRPFGKALGILAAFGLLVVLAAVPPVSLSQYADQTMSRREEPRFKPGMFFDRAVTLGDLWYLQSSAKAKGTGEQISLPGFKVESWYPAVVPSTVLGTLVENNVYKDITFGKNLADVPKEPFAVSWWYRKEFTVPQGPRPHPRPPRVRRHQLPGQYLAQRQEGGRRLDGLRRLPALHHRHHRGRQVDREERPGRRGLPAQEGRAHGRLGRLESGAARQRHGPLPRGPDPGHGRRLRREPLRRHQARPGLVQGGPADGLGRRRQPRGRGRHRHARGTDRGPALLARADPPPQGDAPRRVHPGDRRPSSSSPNRGSGGRTIWASRSSTSSTSRSH